MPKRWRRGEGYVTDCCSAFVLLNCRRASLILSAFFTARSCDTSLEERSVARAFENMLFTSVSLPKGTPRANLGMFLTACLELPAARLRLAQRLFIFLAVTEGLFSRVRRSLAANQKGRRQRMKWSAGRESPPPPRRLTLRIVAFRPPSRESL